MRILANIPSLELTGGVANHYKGLLPFWRYSVRYNIIGRRMGIPGAICLPYDFFRFALMLIFWRPDMVLLNPSLGRTAILRDSLFLWLAKKMGKRVIVFFHGWDPAQERLIDIDPGEFARRFGRADAFIVLAEQFTRKLRSWGIHAPIFLSTTKVDDRLIEGFDRAGKRYGKTLLFLARVEESKGIFIALEAFSEVLEKHPDARFLIAGSGSAAEAAAALVEARMIKNVEFLGHLSGQRLIDVFVESDVYVLPTFHEGMPTSALEAMAFGLPVITRPVGGLADFFQDQRMGYLSDTLDPRWFADAIGRVFSAPELMKRMGAYNHAYAKEHFMAAKVARQLENIMAQV